MTKHYILSLDPAAQYEWDRRTLRDPMTASHPALADLVAEAVGEQAGSYLVAINIEVKVLEKAAVPPMPAREGLEPAARSPLPQLQEMVA